MKNLNDLIIYSRNFLKDNYNLELTHELKINGRLTSSYGHVKFLSDYSNVIEISIAKKLMTYGHKDVILDTLKHELIHYALWKLDKPFHDGDRYFKNELKKHNATAENENHYLGDVYSYECNCGKEYKISKIGNYICKCNNELKLTSKLISDGINFTKIIDY